jgi:type II secretory pathway component PulK
MRTKFQSGCGDRLKAELQTSDRLKGELHAEEGSALIIVLWVAFGLVALTLYFGQSMTFELRAAENRVAALNADQAILGAARYVTNVLSRVQTPGEIPLTNTYYQADLAIGDARVWFIGRNDFQNYGVNSAWGLVDEGSKMNLNSVTYDMLMALPKMTPQLAGAIIDWRDSDDDVAQDGGAETDTYARLTPPYRAKNTNYESAAELRLVQGMDLDMLFGEDGNLNGILDKNENDSEVAMPFDNRDGRLDPGLMEYFTVYTRVPTLGTNITDLAQVGTLLQTFFGNDVALQVANNLRPTIAGAGGGGGGQQQGGQQQGGAPTYGLSNILHFYFMSGLTRDQMAQIEGYLVCTNATNALININTASEQVLACVTNIGYDLAPTMIAYRQSNPSQLNTVAWIKDALNWTWENDRAKIIQTGNYICGRAFQFSADIAAVGPHGRGYKRVKYVFDVADGWAQMRYRQDLTYLGWALGRQVRDTTLASNTRR